MLPPKRIKLDIKEDTTNVRHPTYKLRKRQYEEIGSTKSISSKAPRIEEPAKKFSPYQSVLENKGYTMRKTLGSGSYSKVILAKSKLNKVAVKIINRTKVAQDFQTKFLPRELEIWPKLLHPNIIQFIDTFEKDSRVYVILEYAARGDVLHYIQDVGALSKRLVQAWMWQLCDAVQYIHDLDIAHRDLKLENLLLDNGYNIKLCDFGFVKGDCSKLMSRTFCGSKSYVAPEIFQWKNYDPLKTDIWAVGVILYVMITGKMPFDESKGNASIFQEQLKLEFNWQKYKKLTEKEIGLVHKLFTYDFHERPDIHEVWSSPMMMAIDERVLDDLSSEATSFYCMKHCRQHGDK